MATRAMALFAEVWREYGAGVACLVKNRDALLTTDPRARAHEEDVISRPIQR